LKTGVVVILTLILLAASTPALGASGSNDTRFVQSTFVSVFSDGTAEVNQTLTRMNQSSVTLPLLSPQVGNILVVSRNGTAVSYEIAGGNMTLSTFGVASATLVYDTSALTSKQGSTWDLNLNSPYNVTLILPYQSTVLSVSKVPKTLSTVSGKPELYLTAGAWQVSYGLPINVPPLTSSTAGTASTSSTGAQGPLSSILPPQFLEIAAIAGAVIISGAAVVLRSRSRLGGPELRTDDREILSFIRERGGSVSEVEIRERFSLPRTSAWRQAKRLEKLGLVKITKVGKQNQIELVKTEPEAEP
jgi:uncharacterized membrane protein